MRLSIGINMDPYRVIFLCLIVLLSFTSCLTATLNPQNTWNVNLNSRDPLKTSDEKATTSKTGFDQDTTTGFKFETPGSSAEAPPKLNYGRKSEPSTDFPPKGLSFRIPVNAEAKLVSESKLEKLGVISIDVDAGNIKKNEIKPTSSSPGRFDPFPLIQAEQNVMKKKLAQPPLVVKNKDETSKPEGTTLSSKYSINTVKVSDEKVSEVPLGFLSLYESTPKRKISVVENADKLTPSVHNLGFSGNSSKIFTSSQSMTSQRTKQYASEELKVDSTTSKSTVALNFKPIEPNFMKSQKLSKGQKDTPSEKLLVSSGIVEESTHESLGISWNPTQLPLAEPTTNGIQLKLIPLEKRNKDALTLGEKKGKVNVSDSLLPALDSIQLKAQKMVGTVSKIEQSSNKVASRIEVIRKGLENTILLPKNEDSGAMFQPKTDEPSLNTENANTPSTAFNSGKKDEVVDAGGMIPKGTPIVFLSSSGDNKISYGKKGDTKGEISSKEGLGTKSDGSIKSEKNTARKTGDINENNQDAFARSFMSMPLSDIIYRGNNKATTEISITTNGEFEIKGDSDLLSGHVSRNRVEDVTKSIPVVSVASSSSTPSSYVKYRGNVKFSDMKINANTKYSSKGKLEAKGETDMKGVGDLQLVKIPENKVEDFTKSNKASPAGSLVSTHFPDIYYISNVNVFDSKMNKTKIYVDIGLKKFGENVGSKPEGITSNILNASTGGFVSTVQPDVRYIANDKIDVRKTKEEMDIKSGLDLQSRKISGSKVEEVTKITPAVSVEPLISTPFPAIQYKLNDKVDKKMNADSEFSSKVMLKAGGKGFQLGRISESKMGDVILTSSESPSVKPKGV